MSNVPPSDENLENPVSPERADVDSAATTGEVTETPVYDEVVADVSEPAAAEPTPLVEPEEPAAVTAGPAFAPAPPAVPEASVVAEPVVAEPVAVEPTSAQDVIPPAEPAPSAVTPQTIYVQTPTPPRKKGNRGFGVLFALLGTLVFALAFALVTLIVMASFYGGDSVADRFGNFLGSSGFIVPTLTFLVAFVLAVLLVNRAGWWAWVLGSLIVAAVTYFASIGVILLMNSVILMTPSEASLAFVSLAVSAPLIIAALVAREVSIWFGAAIARRGRTVKQRNIEAREAYDRELAESRARH
ncbi:hypothetical protein FB562_2500 [Homoserinimonas aerilata]|uniref:Uncharacterized protein n=1 Tax=Homoserinimonas aerilata TaxID=1162970 RepID=A0A542Y1G3_9MICO|nr:hypothetical protein [Homoserinimonas aerilata]TQL41914.1 hypothetical protein FB562_2500 [Homoserinimonas aerilata]